MENNLKERIEDVILNEGVSYLNVNNQQRVDIDKNSLIETILQLTKEVEKNLITKLTLDNTLYTKGQVEELLQKQRELCLKKAKLTGIVYGNDKSISDYEIDKNSILNSPNAKFE